MRTLTVNEVETVSGGVNEEEFLVGAATVGLATAAFFAAPELIGGAAIAYAFGVDLAGGSGLALMGAAFGI